jgi:CHASE2 domain-containing sensor protein
MLQEKVARKKFIQRCKSLQSVKKGNMEFYKTFAQAKNLIENQIKAGNKIKTRNFEISHAKEKVKEMKVSYIDFNMNADIQRNSLTTYSPQKF